MRKKKLIPVLMCMLLTIGRVASANTLNYPKTDYKDISTSESSDSNTFPYSKSYSDHYGYTGTYYKDGSSQVIRGSASESKYVTVTIDSSYNNFDSSTSYNKGGYSGSLRKDGPVKNNTRSKVVSGSSLRAEQFNQKCTASNGRKENPNWDPAKFDHNNKATHEYFEDGTVWSSEFHAGYNTVNTTNNFTPSYSGVNVSSVYYDDGTFSGYVQSSLNNHSTQHIPRYMLTPGNNYTPPHVGQQCAVRVEKYIYNFSGTVSAASYSQTYSGYVSTDDTRVWRQDYKGTASKVINHTLDAQISDNMPMRVEEDSSFDLKITAKNTGDITWTEKDLIRLKKVSGNLEFPDKLKLPSGVNVSSGQSYTWTVTIPKMKKGTYNINLKMIKDNGDGYFGNELSHSLMVYDLIPVNGDVNIKGYEYLNNNKYYIRPNKNIEISSNGYFEEYVGAFPSLNYITYAKDGDINSSANVISKTGDAGTTLSGTNKDSFQKVNDSKINKFSKYEKRYIENSQMYTLKGNSNEDTQYKLYNQTSYIRNDKEHTQGYTDSNKWIYVDGTAPTGTVLADMDSDTYDISVDVRNVTDNGGSGVKEVFAMYYNANNKQNGKVRRNLSLKNGNWVDNVNSSALFNDDIEVEIYAVDNVGNQRLLDSKILYRFNVKATIVPYNDKSYSGSKPTLKRGQKGVIKIATTGEPTQLQITFSNDLLEQDNSLNAIIDLQPKKQLTTEYEFIVPLYADMKDYTVNVNAIKGNRTKEVNPQFIVNDSITDNLRTRRKY